MPGFVLLVRDRKDNDPAIRLGITVTKKIGGAVVRNRMKRRFRVLARQILPHEGFSGADHVLIGRAGGVERDFASLTKELRKALGRLRSPDASSTRGANNQGDGNRQRSRKKQPKPAHGAPENAGNSGTSSPDGSHSGEAGIWQGAKSLPEKSPQPTPHPTTQRRDTEAEKRS